MARSVRWQGRTDGGEFGLRSVAWMVGHLGARFVYFLMGFAIPFYVVLRPSHSRAVYRFYRTCLGMGIFRSCYMTLSCYLTFGKVIVDKFAFFGGVTKGYVLEKPKDCVDEAVFASSEGAVFATAHVGNPEAVGSLLYQERKQMYCLVYAGESEQLLRRRADALSASNVKLIPVGNDMGYIFELSAALNDGGVAVMTADRLWGGKGVSADLFGRKAVLPVGAFAIGSRLGVPVYTLFVMRSGHKRYRLILERIDGTCTVEEMAAVYARRLESVVREYPSQWFNFYEFFENTLE